MAGTLACLFVVAPHDVDGALARRLHAMQGPALALLTAASFGILLSRTLEMNGGAWNLLWHDMRLVLTVTHFGYVWWWRVPSLALLWIGWWLSLRSPGARWAQWLMVPATAAIALTRSETGHPVDHGDFTASVWIDCLHLLAAGAWVGSLFGMTLAVFPRLLRVDAPCQAARIFQRLSTLSGAALAILVACGIWNAIQQLGSADALWTTRYGINLDVKLVLVLPMILIGAHNRYVKLPRLLAGAGLPEQPSPVARWMRGSVVAKGRAGTEVLRSCARTVLMESLLAVAVIGATGILLHAMPPADRHALHGHAASSNPTAAPSLLEETETRSSGSAPEPQAFETGAAR